MEPDEWLHTRQILQAHRLELTDAAGRLYAGHARVAGTPLLTRTEWVPARPVDLEAIKLDQAANPGAPIDGRGRMTENLRAVDASGRRYGSYAETMAALARPATFENRTTYRPVSADLSAVTPQLAFSPGGYFDSVNVGEAAGHELAAAWHPDVVNVSMQGLPLRSAIADPCDLLRRPTPLAITTLTLRHDRRGGATSCVLHWRDPGKVAHAGGLYQVMPVGVFQPLTSSPASWHNDFDLWRAMVREYHEEFLGGSEDYQADGGVLDYEAWPFYSELASARASGCLRVWCLGMGVDPVTLAVDLLTVAVFDADAFDAAFDGSVEVNEEGKAVAGVPFDLDTLGPFLTGVKPMQSAGAAVLVLALRHRATLLAPAYDSQA